MVHYDEMKMFGNVMCGAGTLLLLAAAVLSLLGAAAIFTAPASYWTEPGQELLVSSYLAGSLATGVLGAGFIGLGLLIVRPQVLWKPVMVLGAVYFLAWLAESIFLAVKGTNWLNSFEDVATFVVCLLPGIAAVMESRALRKARHSQAA